MWSSTLRRQESTTASTAQVSSEVCLLEKRDSEIHHVHIAWELAVDNKGNSRPRMHWLID